MSFGDEGSVDSEKNISAKYKEHEKALDMELENQILKKKVLDLTIKLEEK